MTYSPTHGSASGGPDALMNTAGEATCTGNERALTGQARVLEMIASEAPIDLVLLEVCKLIEEADPQLITGVHIVDAAGVFMERMVGPRLSPTLIDACREWPLNDPERTGNCMIALANGGPVAAAQGVQAMLCIPLIRHDGLVLGRLFAARAEPAPDISAWNTELVDVAARLAGLALQRELSRKKLKELHETLEREVAERTRERDRIWRNSRDLLVAVGNDGVLRAVNAAWTALLGYAPEELIGQRFDLFVHPEDIESTSAAVEHASREPLAHFENRYRHKDGSYRWFAWRGAPEEGVIYANGRDITLEKKQAEQLLIANEARLQLALEAGAMGAWHGTCKRTKVSGCMAWPLCTAFQQGQSRFPWKTMRATSIRRTASMWWS
jgi:PAS domain S-box-containing protein